MRKTILSILSLALLLSSCKKQVQEWQRPEHEVLVLESTDTDIEEKYSAAITGQQDVEIYPQVSGTISRICITEGKQVSKGELLFVIDQRPYKAALQRAVANSDAAKAQVETAMLTYESKQVLFEEKVISEYELTTARNELLAARAGQAQAEAEVESARNNLSYTEICSPSDGVVGTLPFRTGALVGPSITRPLTTVSDNSRMHVYFSMTENQIRPYIHEFGSLDSALSKMPAIRLQLNDGTLYEAAGRIESISGIINPKTGTLSVRSRFPNEKKVLFSGSYGNVIIPHKLKNVLVIPQSATYELQDKIFVYKVENGKSVSVPVTVGKLNDGNNYIVHSGLKQGDTIVSEGVSLLQDGMEITVKQITE
jgi:RND family efflux transporter, MFP subunit